MSCGVPNLLDQFLGGPVVASARQIFVRWVRSRRKERTACAGEARRGVAVGSSVGARKLVVASAALAAAAAATADGLQRPAEVEGSSFGSRDKRAGTIEVRRDGIPPRPRGGVVVGAE